MSTIHLFLVLFFVLVLDQATKYLAQVFLSSSVSFPIIRGIFHLTLVHNSGAAFGLLKGGTFLFIIISIICVIAIVLLLKNNALFSKIFALDAQDKLVRFSLGLILGGAFGNLIDRLRFSYVVDFLDFRIWPVFNVADSAITIGGIVLFFRILINKKTVKN